MDHVPHETSVTDTDASTRTPYTTRHSKRMRTEACNSTSHAAAPSAAAHAAGASSHATTPAAAATPVIEGGKRGALVIVQPKAEYALQNHEARNERAYKGFARNLLTSIVTNLIHSAPSCLACIRLQIGLLGFVK